jgi:AraC-like DNA-binding protein
LKTREKYFTFGLASGRAQESLWREFHRHNEIELQIIECGSLTYLFAGGRIDRDAGQLAVFWGAMPHQLVRVEKGTIAHWLTIPLAWYLEWQLPEAFNRAVLDGNVMLEPDAGRSDSDLESFKRWHADLASKLPERRKLVLLETEARLRRLALSRPAGARREAARATKSARVSGSAKVDQMAAFIAERYTEPLRVSEIAQHAGLHPDYATTLFRKALGMGLVDYVNQHRISHAQRLLATTDLKILQIAFDSGFGSASRFYAAFMAECGQSPKQYRASMHAR